MNTENKKFRSAVGKSIKIAVVLYHLLLIGIFILSFFLWKKDAIFKSTVGLLIFMDIFFLLPVIFNTYYTLEEETLFIYQWPFVRKRIKFSNIFTIDVENAETNEKPKTFAMSNQKILIGYYVFSEDKKEKEKKYIEISPREMDLFLIKMGGKFKRARDLAAKLEEEHKQKNAEHHRKKEIADKARQEKAEANKPTDVVVKSIKKGEGKAKVKNIQNKKDNTDSK